MVLVESLSTVTASQTRTSSSAILAPVFSRWVGLSRVYPLLVKMLTLYIIANAGKDTNGSQFVRFIMKGRNA
jgi:hypothetical protein